MLIKIVAVQALMGQPLSMEEKLYIFRQRPDIVCLPEYWVLENGVDDFKRAALDRNRYADSLAQLSDELDTIMIGGSLIEAEGDQLFNTTLVHNRGGLMGKYRKVNPVPGELKAGISPGREPVVIKSRVGKIGLLLCGDVFFEDNFRQLGQLEPDLIFVPTTSPYRPDDSISAKHRRDIQFFQTGAQIAGAYVIKVCGVGQFMNKPLQGRSLITSPWEMIKRVAGTSEQSPRILTATLDLDEIRDFKLRLKNRNDQKSIYSV